MLEINDIHAGYGAIKVLHGVSREVNAGEIVTLIGANGVGKTTLMKTIAGVIPATSGSVRLDGIEVTNQRPHLMTRRGLSLVMEGRGILTQMSVEENLVMGGFLNTAAANSEMLDHVYEMFPVLAERRGQLGGTLSGGEQQMLAMGRALMARPKMLMLDEPSLGLAPMIVARVFEWIEQTRSADTAILLVEQNAFKALNIADRGYVMAGGRITMQGTGEDLLNDPEVPAAYLGARRRDQPDAQAGAVASR